MKQKKDEKINNSKNKKKTFLRIFLFILIAIWAIIVFNFSSQNGGDSSGLSKKIVELFTKNEETINLVEPYVRKFAHFSEYGLRRSIIYIFIFNFIIFGIFIVIKKFVSTILAELSSIFIFFSTIFTYYFHIIQSFL